MGRRFIGIVLLLFMFCCIASGMVVLLWFLFGPSFSIHFSGFGIPATTIHFDSLPSRSTPAPQPEPTATLPWSWEPTATRRPHYEYLSCYDCAAEGMEINLWAYDGDKRTRIVGSLPHGTRVRVLATDWSDAEGRYYHHVEGDGEKGWVSANFVTPHRP
jgi:hypothetical protein